MFDIPLLFVHIPKTAGTSFRRSLEDVLDDQHIIRDYGAGCRETSPVILRQIYQTQPDVYEVYAVLQKLRMQLITGHVAISKYLMLSRIDRVVTFVRNPVEQVVSHWHHYVRHSDYDGSLETFCKDERFRDLQSKMLGNTSLEMIGHVLIVERYAEGLALFNADYGTDLEVKTANRNKERQGDSYHLSGRDREMIISLNQHDMHLYEHACAIFEQRLAVHKRSEEWVYGRFNPPSENTLMGGWAYQRDLQPAELELLINGRVAQKTRADAMRPLLRRFGKTCIGYHFSVNDVSKGDKIACRAQHTGQVIGSYQL